MIRVGILGGSGYTGVELARLIARHPYAELTVMTSRQHAGKTVEEVFPNLRDIVSLSFEDVALDSIVDKADVIFTAVPHKTAMDVVPYFLEAGKKVIDLSADFRIHDPAIYEAWYQEHSAKEFLGQAVYGLPEIHREQIKQTRLVANPGCYPTSTILGLAPLLRNKCIDPSSLVIDSKSGTSGAGRGAQVGALYCEVTDGFRAYKIGEHRHTPEIEQELIKLAGKELTISFTPHLVPMSRGILTTIYAKALKSIDNVTALYEEFYQQEQFVRVCKTGTFPATQYVRGSNYCDIGCKYDSRTGRFVIISAIDNLVKGAAGQAVQNMNIICDFEENSGLTIVPLFP